MVMARVVASTDPQPLRPRTRIVYEAITESEREAVREAIDAVEARTEAER